MGSSSSSRLEEPSTRSRRRTRSASWPGGLARERQAQHLLGADQPVGDEPHHPRGHRLGLARAGAGGDERGLRGRADDRRLLLGGPAQAEAFGELDGVDELGAADPPGGGDRRHGTCLPETCTGHAVRTGQRGQESFSRPTKIGPSVARAAALTCVAPRGQALVVEGLLRAFLRRAAGPRQVHQARAARGAARGRPVGARERLGERAERGGELVDGELRVLLRGGVGDRRLARLHVDDHGPAVGVDLEPVDPSAHPHALGHRRPPSRAPPRPR